MSAADPRRDSVWWGWGRAEERPSLSAGARAMLADRLGALEPDERVPLEQVGLPEPEPLPDAVIAAAGGPEAVFTEPEDRVRHAAGKSYPDLIRVRTGALEDAPDAVVVPADREALAATLSACAREQVAVVPFGGGTSVVGGVDPARAGFDVLVSLDLTALRDVDVDPVSQTARLGPGLRGPEAEAALARAGFTLGHFPQSYMYATIGGFAATRSAGQASSGYGRFDELVAAIELATPRGPIRTLQTPHTAAGPSLRELALGSEGVLGVVSEVTARVRPIPGARRYEGWIAADFDSGAEIVRALAQGGALPDVVRLSDREETAVSMAMSGLAGLRRSALDAYLGLRRRRHGCVLICGWEGASEDVARRRELSARILRGDGAVRLGRSAGEGWEQGRYEGPYLRDSLLDAGALVETLETSHTWSRLGELYRAVRGALERAMAERGTPGLVMCHLSHAYRDGASLYFTFLCARDPGEELAQWRAIKTAACEAIVAAEGTITHHHAVGRDHAPYMEAELGELGLDALAAVKERLDPSGVMNPGKLLPS